MRRFSHSQCISKYRLQIGEHIVQASHVPKRTCRTAFCGNILNTKICSEFTGRKITNNLGFIEMGYCRFLFYVYKYKNILNHVIHFNRNYLEILINTCTKFSLVICGECIFAHLFIIIPVSIILTRLYVCLFFCFVSYHLPLFICHWTNEISI